MRALAPAATLLLGLSQATAAFAQTAATPGPAPSVQPATKPTPPPTAPPTATAPAASPAAPSEPPDAPPGYYVEHGPGEPPPENGPPANAPLPGANAGANAGTAAGAAPIYEPPPPGMIYEPLPPPVPRHVAPRTALWAGVRLGWFFPFGSAYARGAVNDFGGVLLTSVPWTDYVSSGPALELNLGARLGRNYNVFGLWQHAELTSGNAEKQLHGGQNGGDTDYFAVGLRATSDADSVGLVTEIALGYRQARAVWEDGTELRMTGGVLEGRIGIGADIRLTPLFSVSPMLELGVGSFDRVRRVVPGGGSYDLIGPFDASTSHGWLTLGIAGHADLFGAQ